MDHSQNRTQVPFRKSQAFLTSKHDHWKPIVNAWRDSGLSQSAFCRKNELNRPRFTYWHAKILGKTNKGIRAALGDLVSLLLPGE
ncbi:MAG: hypothetical protein DSZ28_00060 [Thiothrix sp.]|nr:MAG: hypothetical protein DSZ28_00060 [Thiothrix sp.]